MMKASFQVSKSVVAPYRVISIRPARTRAVVLAAAQSPQGPKNPLRQVITTVVQAVSEASAKTQPSDPLMSPLWNAINRCDVDGVNAAIQAGANVNEKNPEGDTPLLFIAKAGHYKYRPDGIPAALVKAGADLEVKSKDGYTAFETSLLKGWQNIGYLLIDSGANTKGVAAIKSRLTCPDCRKLVAEYKL